MLSCDIPLKMKGDKDVKLTTVDPCGTSSIDFIIVAPTLCKNGTAAYIYKKKYRSIGEGDR